MAETTREPQPLMRGIMNEMYIDDVRDKTHRGLTGKVLDGFSSGGRCYGYKSLPIEHDIKKDEHGRPLIIASKRAIDEEEAKWVRRIFEWFGDGRSARWIAGELNRLCIASFSNTCNQSTGLTCNQHTADVSVGCGGRI